MLPTDPIDPNRLPPIYHDLYFLYREIRRRRPGYVLEFGCGYSTLVIAKALYDNGGGEAWSLETEPYWANNTRQMIPHILDNHYRILEVGVTDKDYGEDKALWFSEIPNCIPEFIYVDAPATDSEIQGVANILEMEPLFKKGFFMVVDGRKQAVKFFRKNLRRNYVFQDRRLFGNSAFELIG